MRNISNYAKLGLLTFLIACSSSVALAKSSRPAGLYLNPFLGPPGTKIKHVTVALFPNRQYCMQSDYEPEKVRRGTYRLVKQKIYLDNGMKLAKYKDDFGDPSHEFYSLSQNGKEIDMLGYFDDQFLMKREGVSPKKFWRSLKIQVCKDYR
ncbi:hypothetical protein [Neisseria sicca]|jgi:hypothetical protein|uniref:hypothetical protein n=1 Tax=Neisseria sicca TaxID=490 RepID=UPI0021BE0710|nr:hypothetical protein [Neisseria sicca]